MYMYAKWSLSMTWYKINFRFLETFSVMFENLQMVPLVVKSNYIHNADKVL